MGNRICSKGEESANKETNELILTPSSVQSVFNMLQDTREFTLVLDPNTESFLANHVDSAVCWDGSRTAQAKP